MGHTTQKVSYTQMKHGDVSSGVSPLDWFIVKHKQQFDSVYWIKDVLNKCVYTF